MTESLSEAERLAVYHIQCDLGAVKQCQQCGQIKRIGDFAGYGRLNCWDCFSVAFRPAKS